MNKFKLALLALVPLSIAGGVAAWMAAGAVASGAVEVYKLTPADPKLVEVNRGLFELDPPPKTSPDYARKVMSIYGTPSEAPERLLFVDPKLIVRPKEYEAVAFLPVGGKDPMQAKMVEFFGTLALKASVVAAAFFVLANLLVFATVPARGGRSAAAD